MSAEAERILDNLARSAKHTERTTKDVAKELMLHGRFFSCGYLYEPTFRHLGLGVYEVSARPWRGR